MTHDQHDHRSVQDMNFVLAESRIAHLRASASPAPDTNAAGTVATAGVIARTRDALGRRLIALGGSVVADEALRRRALHL